MAPSDDWQYTEIASNEVIDALLEAFRRICYPMYVDLSPRRCLAMFM